MNIINTFILLVMSIAPYVISITLTKTTNKWKIATYSSTRTQFRLMCNPINQEVRVDSCTVFRHELFSEFLMRSPSTHISQREHIEEHVKYFYDRIVEYYLGEGKTNTFPVPFLSMLTMGIYRDKFYIIDGQHRYLAYKRFYDANKGKTDFPIAYVIRKYDELEDMRKQFRDINSQVLHDEATLSSVFSTDREVLKEFVKKKYGAHLSNASNPRYPNVNLDVLINASYKRFLKSRIVDLVEFFETWNIDVGTALRENGYDDLILVATVKPKQGLFLGSFSKQDELKKSIPRELRTKLWDTKAGDVENVPCYCCRVKVSMSSFHAGWKRSLIRGGLEDISNLDIICGTCHWSMGQQDMDGFRNKYFSSEKEKEHILPVSDTATASSTTTTTSATASSSSSAAAAELITTAAMASAEPTIELENRAATESGERLSL